jgi:hypothetical protein
VTVAVTVIGPVKCKACGAYARMQWQGSKGAAAARGTRRMWGTDEPPITFTVETWSRGGPHRMFAAGEFPGWDELIEIARGAR